MQVDPIKALLRGIKAAGRRASLGRPVAPEVRLWGSARLRRDGPAIWRSYARGSELSRRWHHKTLQTNWRVAVPRPGDALPRDAFP